MAGSGPTALPQLFNELHRCCQNQEFQRVVQVANRILQDSPQDADAFKCKVLAMIHQSAFNDVVTLLNKNAVLGKGMVFEKAYAEYRLNRLDESLRTLKTGQSATEAEASEISEAESFRRKELEAQIYYRLEKYEDCLGLYKQLLKERSDDYEEERLTNVSAVAAALSQRGSSSSSRALADSVESIIDAAAAGGGQKTFELCFNRAFLAISDGDYAAAESQLREAEQICSQSFEDDPEAMEEEMVVIKTQLAFVLQMRGRNNEANNIYNAVLKQRDADQAVLAVASNNIVTLNRDQNIFDSKKKIKTATASGLHHKLVQKQQRAIALNHALILMYSGQGDQCRKIVKTLMDKGGDAEEDLILVLAASYLREKKNPEAVSTLQEFISSRNNESSLRASLALVQLHLQQGSVSLAIEALKGLKPSSAFRPGIIATVVALFKNLEEKDAAIDYLSAAIAYNKEDGRLDAVSLESLMRECASAMLAAGMNARAVAVLEDLRRRNPKDLRVLAQLITAYAVVDPVAAQKVSRDLPSPEEMAQGVNVDELEAHCFAAGPKYSKKAQVKDAGKDASSPGAGAAASKAPELLAATAKKRRKRKGKMPKNFDPKVDPDPERWLPRKDRSTYKGRRRDKRKDAAGIGKGTQGGVANVEGLDASKPPPGAVPKAASPHAASPTPPPQSGGSGKASTPTPAGAASTGKPAGAAKTNKKPQPKKKKKGGW